MVRVGLTLCGCLLTLFPCSVCCSQSNNDWCGFRGNLGTATANPDSILSSATDFRLKLRWKQPLGSGYSGIAICSDRIVTMFSDADQDKLVCMNTINGSKRWEIPIDDRFIGHNGSFDGPIATPVTDGQTIVALSAQGKLLAVNLGDGTVKWSKQLTDAPIQAPPPMYGFATSPLIVDGTVVVICGAKDAFMVGFDLNSGKVKWTSGSDGAQCQSPVLMTLAGKLMIVAAGMKKLIGVEPSTGNVLFETEHQGSGARGAMTIVPVPVDDNHVFIAHDDHFSSLYEISRRDGLYRAKRVWKTPAIRNTYSVPVFCGGRLFGYNNRMLAAVDPESGTESWRCREPGDGFPIAIDSHLIIATKNGGLDISKASQKKFENVASIQLFDDLVWSIPAFSNNAIYIRSLGEIACVEIVSEPAATGIDASNNADTLPMSTVFRHLIESVRAETDTDKQSQRIDDFVNTHPNSPFIDEGIAHFYYRGDAQDVAIGSDLFGSRQEKKMKRLGDLFYYSVDLPPDQRANYTYFVDYESKADPRNRNNSFVSSLYVDDMEVKVTTTTQAKPVTMSRFAMPDWKPPAYLPTLDDSSASHLKGSVIQHKFQGKFPGDVYLPPGYDNDETRYPVVYVHGPDARSEGRIDRAVDELIQLKTIRPCILVFLPMDIGDPDPMKYPEFVGKSLVPEVDQTFRTLADRDHRSNYATGFYAPMALLTAAMNPEILSATAVQSPFVFGADAEGAFEQFKKIEQPYRFYLEWGRFDMFNPDENWDMREIARRVHDQVQAMNNMSVSGGMVNDTSGWKSWQTRFDRVLRCLVDKLPN